MLVEESVEVNMGTKDNPRVIYFAASLTEREQPKFCNFFTER